MKLKLAVTFIVLGLSGCSHQYPLLPNPESTQKIEGIKVTYILPNDIIKTSDTINGIYLDQYGGRTLDATSFLKSGGQTGRKERLHFDNKGNQLEIERRTDNGIAGSGVVCIVDFDVISEPDRTKVVFTPKTRRTYQQGVLLPFPVPDFDVETYLLEGQLTTSFEMDADYPPEAVRANLRRLLHGGLEDRYTLDNENEQIIMTVRVDPYKHNQSKLTINATIYNKRSNNRIINMVEKINALKKQLHNAVNA